MLKTVTMRQVTAFVFFIAVALLFVGLLETPLAKSTEPRVAGIAADMYLNNNYIAPRLNNTLFLEKPPLHAWLTAASFEVFGLNNISARLPSVVAGIATLLLIMSFLAMQNTPPIISAFSALILLTMGSFWMYSRLAGQDVLLCFGVTMGLLYTYYFSIKWQWRPLIGVAIGMAIASTTKGIFGIALICCVAAAYLPLKMGFIDKKARPLPIALYGLAVIIGLIPLSIWLWLLYQQNDWDAFYEITWVNSVGRFMGEYQNGGHVQAWYYYLVRIPTFFQPWFALVIPAAIFAIKRARLNSASLFYLCWLIMPLILLSVSSSKRSIYLLSIYPAAALLIGAIASKIFQDSEQVKNIGEKLISGSLIFQGLITTVILVYCLVLNIKDQPTSLLWFVIHPINIGVLIWTAKQLFNKSQGAYIAGNLLIICLCYLNYAATSGVQESTNNSLVKVFAELSPEDRSRSIAIYTPHERLSGGAVYYLQHSVDDLHTPDQLRNFMAVHQDYILISENEELLAHPGTVTTVMLKKDPYYILKASNKSGESDLNP